MNYNMYVIIDPILVKRTYLSVHSLLPSSRILPLPLLPPSSSSVVVVFGLTELCFSQHFISLVLFQ